MSPSFSPSSVTLTFKSMTTQGQGPPSSVVAAPSRRRTTTANNNMSAFEARVSLIFALASQTTSVSQRLLADLATETAKYVFPKRFESRNLEEALMSVPDLETVKFKVVSRNDEYDIRELEMEDQDEWKMSFLMPSKYGSNLPLPKNSAVTIKEVPSRTMAVVAFSGFVTDEDVMRRESTLRNALKNDTQYKVKSGASVEVAQYNPPFTLPFTRRNEISLQVERKQE